MSGLVELQAETARSLLEIGIHLERIREESAVKRDCEKKLRKLRGCQNSPPEKIKHPKKGGGK